MLRRIVIVLVLLLGLAVATDYVARLEAQRVVAIRIQRSEGLSQRPTVSLRGFPLLTQAIRGVYREVDIDLSHVPAPGGLRVDRLEVRLFGVHLPPRYLLGDRPSGVPVDLAQLTGTVGYSTLDDLLAQQLRQGLGQVRLAGGSNGRLRVEGRYTGLGGPLSFTGEATLAARNGRVTLTVSPGSLTDLPAASRGAVAGSLSRSIDLGHLPLGLKVTDVSAAAAGVSVTARATHVVLPGTR
jgi:hypothetical protein